MSRSKYNWGILWVAYFAIAIFGEIWMRESGIGFHHVFANGDKMSWDWFVFFKYNNISLIILPVAMILCAKHWTWRHSVTTIEFIIFRLLVYWDFYQSNNHEHTALIYEWVIVVDLVTTVVIGMFYNENKIS